MMSLRDIAHRLGGEVYGSFVLVPGPNHSRRDRSLKVMLSSSGENGFIVHSYAGDDWKECRAYVRHKLGLSRETRTKKSLSRTEVISPQQERDAKARELWASARTDDLRQHLRLIYPQLFREFAAGEG
jgi:putative DNA primase/helicase